MKLKPAHIESEPRDLVLTPSDKNALAVFLNFSLRPIRGFRRNASVELVDDMISMPELGFWLVPVTFKPLVRKPSLKPVDPDAPVNGWLVQAEVHDNGSRWEPPSSDQVDVGNPVETLAEAFEIITLARYRMDIGAAYECNCESAFEERPEPPHGWRFLDVLEVIKSTDWIATGRDKEPWNPTPAGLHGTLAEDGQQVIRNDCTNAGQNPKS